MNEIEELCRQLEKIIIDTNCYSSSNYNEIYSKIKIVLLLAADEIARLDAERKELKKEVNYWTKRYIKEINHE